MHTHMQLPWLLLSQWADYGGLSLRGRSGPFVINVQCSSGPSIALHLAMRPDKAKTAVQDSSFAGEG